MKGIDRIISISCSDDSRLLAISRNDSTVEFFDLISARPAKKPFKVHYNVENHFMFVDNYSGITYGGDHSFRVWAIDTGIRKGLVTGHSNKVIGATKLTQKQLLSCSIDRSIRLWDIEKNYICTKTYSVESCHPALGTRPLKFRSEPRPETVADGRRICDCAGVRSVPSAEGVGVPLH